MPNTNIQNTQRTDCNNGECVQITTTCIDGSCTERRVVVPAGTTTETTYGTSSGGSAGGSGGGGGGASDTSSDTSSDDGCEFEKANFAIVFNGNNVTLFAGILSFIMCTVFMIGLFKIKKK